MAISSLPTVVKPHDAAQLSAVHIRGSHVTAACYMFTPLVLCMKLIKKPKAAAPQAGGCKRMMQENRGRFNNLPWLTNHHHHPWTMTHPPFSSTTTHSWLLSHYLEHTLPQSNSPWLATIWQDTVVSTISGHHSYIVSCFFHVIFSMFFFSAVGSWFWFRSQLGPQLDDLCGFVDDNLRELPRYWAGLQEIRMDCPGHVQPLWYVCSIKRS